MLLRGLLLAALAAAGVAVAGAFAADGPLTATVGPGFTIRILGPDGFPVKQIDAGTYQLVIDDRSEEHNFHLTGPGVEETTGVEEVGSKTVTVTFKDGRYRFLCDPHSGTMTGTFNVGAGPPPTPPAAQATKLTAVVGPGPAIALKTAAGAKARALKPGAYAITVRDLSKTHNFHLTGPGVNRKTGLAQTTTVTWKVTLKAGALLYVSDASPKTLRGTAVVR
ncbi:MAG TPA: plastocyanin/azurin family copper-binding protein [Gaiellaceae bacterium]|nr:plastocyanin/azurin family copper-binding protein [Gaiellaceae bacterium]